MNSLDTLLQKDPFLNKIYHTTKRKKLRLYLVGGFLRDFYIGRLSKDYDLDFAIKKGAIKIAGGLAKKFKSGFVVLDKTHGTARVIYKLEAARHTIDFSDFRAKTIKQDLYQRDFTINTLALDLGRLRELGDFKKEVFDYYGAINDIDKQKIKVLNIHTFDSDPLRILRAFSLSAILGFSIEKSTLRLIRQRKDKLRFMPGERIKEELFKILGISEATKIFKQMDRFKVLEVIIPQIRVMYGISQGPYHHLDVWKHSLETLHQLELYIKQLSGQDKLRINLEEFISSNHKRYQLLKLAALFHDIGKPQSLFIEDGKTKFYGHEKLALEILEPVYSRLKISNKEKEALNKMVRWHLRPGFLSDSQPPSRRAKFRFFRDTAQEAISVLLLSLADQRATRGPLTNKQSRDRHEKLIKELISEYFRKLEEKKPPRLISGDDLIKKFKLTPSPLIGKILTEIEEAQAEGRIYDKPGALDWAAGFIKRNK